MTSKCDHWIHMATIKFFQGQKVVEICIIKNMSVFPQNGAPDTSILGIKRDRP